MNYIWIEKKHFLKQLSKVFRIFFSEPWFTWLKDCLIFHSNKGLQLLAALVAGSLWTQWRIKKTFQCGNISWFLAALGMTLLSCIPRWRGQGVDIVLDVPHLEGVEHLCNFPRYFPSWTWEENFLPKFNFGRRGKHRTVLFPPPERHRK